MHATASDFLPARPSRATAVAVSAVLIALMGWIRLALFADVAFPLTYVLPLLAGVWLRDKLLLWSMAACFVALHLIKLYIVLPPEVLTDAEEWANLTGTLISISVGASVVHLIIDLRARLDTSLSEVSAQADQLRAQADELAQQHEELAEQTEELSRQTEELSRQGEELAVQNESIGALNFTLDRREQLLEALLDAARASDSEHAALQHIASAGLELFGDIASLVAIYEASPKGPTLHAHATDPAMGETFELAVPHPELAASFAALVMAEDRMAALNDAAARPDLTLPTTATGLRTRSALGAPIRIGTGVMGALVVYGVAPQDWTEEHFQLAEWLAYQCGRALQMLRLQADLRAADDRKSEFLATLSHELRNPLAPMRVALPLIAKGGPTATAAMQIMERQFKQLVRLVDDLLDLTRLSRNKIQLQKERIDLVEVVTHACEALRLDIEGSGKQLIVAVPPSPVWVDADGQRVEQVVANLLTNATRYTPTGGRITVTLRQLDAETTVSVVDTGVGISPGDLERVFDMFTQIGGPGSGGLGIGLALVRGIVELHGGRICASSDGLGTGSTFVFSLPLSLGHLPLVTPAPTPPRSPARRVLVVDDNRDATSMLQVYLQMHGHTVTVADSAAAALAVVASTPIDVALLDIGLPDMDGYTLARRLRANPATRHIRLVAVTGWGQEEDKARALSAGFDAHLTKPAEPELVLGML